MTTALALIVALVATGEVFSQPITRAEVAARIAQGEPARGSDKAPVTLMEFSDFQCGFCRKFWQTTLPQLDKKYFQTAKVRFVYRHTAILSQSSVAAAEASECAGEQGLFWPLHDRLFARQRALSGEETPASIAQGLEGLQRGPFERCLSSERARARVTEDQRLAERFGARGTPTFFVNGRVLVGAQPLERFVEAVERERSAAQASDTPREQYYRRAVLEKGAHGVQQ